jgi:hypothetical protein
MIFHPSITREKVSEAVRRYDTSLDNPGFCNACGAEVDGCEPDMRHGECELCGEREVFGAMELLFWMF